MTFNSLQYAVFLPVVLALYWRLGHHQQNRLLLVASYAFYGAFDWRFLGLLALSSAVDYQVGRELGRASTDERHRRLVFAASLVVNLGILGAFKYYDFFVTSGARILHDVGLDVHPALLHVALPVGISFYTFHGISYTFDVYRRHLEPATTFASFAVFVAYFPQLVAGPIGRAGLQLPQFEHPRTRPDSEQRRSAAVLILRGLLKKVVIADLLAPVATGAFNQSAGAGAAGLLVGVYAFAFQIYGDFSGYSDIARGSSRLLGIELITNFRQPYLSASITDFWRRWHISLSNWLRDYLYIPLGGNRSSRWRTYRNLLLTMLIGGLWHGAAWTFVAWGAMHGVALLFERFAGDVRTPPRNPSILRMLARWAITFHVVCAGWIFFRASSFHQASQVFEGIASLRRGMPDLRDASRLLLLGGLCLAIDAHEQRSGDELGILRLPVPVRGVTYGVAAFAIVMASGSVPVPFIYFHF